MAVSSPSATATESRHIYESPPPTPRHHCQLAYPKRSSVVPQVPTTKSQKSSVESVDISSGLHFLMTPCSLRSLLPDQAYTKFVGRCTNNRPVNEPEETKSCKRLRKVSFDVEPRVLSDRNSDITM